MELTNSRRRLDKVTYTPLILPKSQDGGGTLEVAAAVAGLGLQPGEGAASAQQGADQRAAAALGAMDAFVAAQDPSTRLARASDLAKMAPVALTGAIDAIRAHRERLLNDTIADLASLAREYRAAHPPVGASGTAVGLDARMRIMEAAIATLLPRDATDAENLAVRTEVDRATRAAPLIDIPIPVAVAARLGSQASDAYKAASWADTSQAERAKHLVSIAASVIPSPLRSSVVDLVMSGIPFLIDQTRVTATIKSNLAARELQPIGVLHLEQLVMTPLDIARGELLYSLPLAPNEKVTLSHKEWSLRQEEYTRFVQDYLENYSERGVADKTDIAVSTKSQTEHTKTLSMSKPNAPGGATLADPVDTQPAGADITKETNSKEQSRRDTHETTEKASALTIRDQKISFTTTTTSGTTDFTSRLFVNRHKDKVMRVDYFRFMRKWRNQLFRVGIRLTYDVVLPDPGRRLRERWRAVSAIDAKLATEFVFELSPGSSNLGIAVSKFSGAFDPIAPKYVFGGTSSDIEEMSADDIERTARRYGVSLPPAPNTLTALEEIKAITEVPTGGRDSISFTLTLNIPLDYRPTKIRLGGRLAQGNNDQFMVADYWKLTTVVNADEKPVAKEFNVPASEATASTISGGFIVYNGAVGEARAAVTLTPTPEAWRKWRSIAYLQIRQGAIARWNEQRESLRQQRAALLKELNAPDTLTLRRMEREQVMLLVLEWLFPDFSKSAQVYQGGGAQAVLEYGEYIKFVHEAIDWEAILVLLYPYFWDRPENHADKLYLDHADGTHREFLRAGACRVIMAITPGFEEQLISLLDKGQIGALTPASRFSKAVAAVTATEKEFATARAKSTAPPAGGAVAPDPAASYGTLIGEWLEWTPTSALDIDVTLKDLI
jgi:hypothetical protein